jgi:hypothetical protein
MPKFGLLAALILAALAGPSMAFDATEEPVAAPNPTMYRQEVPVIQPSRLALEVGDNGAYGAIVVGQGAEVQFSDWFKIGAGFQGTFDYNHGPLQGPLVVRELNPNAFGAFTWRAKPVTIALPFGWGSQSNGQALRSRGQWTGGESAEHLQDLAHMGWDYLWARFYISNTSNLTRHELSFNGSIEYRMFGGELFDVTESDNMNDKAVFVQTKEKIGYQHYDGLRGSFGARYEWFALQLSGKLGTSGPIGGSGGAMMSFDLPEEIRKTFPIAPYIGGEYGYGVNLSHYFEKTWKVGGGVVVRNPVLHAFWD